MLNEVRTGGGAGQERRHWYHSPRGDLYAWHDDAGRWTSFEATCYDDSEHRREWWVAWDGRDLRAGWVDSKEVDGRTHDLNTPTVMMSDGALHEAARRVKEFLLSEKAPVPVDIVALLERYILPV